MTALFNIVFFIFPGIVIGIGIVENNYTMSLFGLGMLIYGELLDIHKTLNKQTP
jgi:hypothetical protein